MRTKANAEQRAAILAAMHGTPSRFCVCRVGEGYSVEDRRTGERVSYHRSYDAAHRRMLKVKRGRSTTASASK